MLDKDFFKTITILYVEDDKVEREELSSLFQKILKKVYIAIDGQDALDQYNKYSNEIDLVLSDINMPNINGIELLEKIKEKDKKIPFIFTTAYTESEYLISAIKQGVSDYFIKPSNIPELLKKIKDISKTKTNEKKIKFIQDKTSNYLNIINQVAIVYIFDEKGTLVYVNNFLEKLSNCEKDELINKDYKSIFHPDMSKVILDKQWNDLQNKQTWSGKIKYISKDNSVFYTNATIIPSEYNGVGKFICINFLTTKEENERRAYKKKVLYNLQETKKIFTVAQNKINTLNKTLEQFKGYDKKAKELQELKIKNNNNFKEIQMSENKIKNIKNKLDQLTYGVNSKIQKVAIATGEMKELDERSGKKINKTIKEIKIREQFIKKIQEEIVEKSNTIVNLKDVLSHRDSQIEES